MGKEEEGVGGERGARTFMVISREDMILGGRPVGSTEPDMARRERRFYQCVEER